MDKVENICIGIVGLGYVGLPLACLFANKYQVVGFDINSEKIHLLQNGIDYTKELNDDDLKQRDIQFSSNPESLQNCDIIIIAVPTDIDSSNSPDLVPLKKASEIVGASITKGATIVFESTVYPGLTEEICIPILEKASGLVWKEDFNVGYSPERINPGDKARPLKKIVKIVSGDTEETLNLLAQLYGSVIEAGIYKAPNIKTAEAAKVIENAQRDLNIAFMNELALIFDRMQLDTRDVLKAAATKWNFLPFEPGLVGGHCIGVDPYYLTYKAEQLGYSPDVINSGRNLNNRMGKFIAEKVLKVLITGNKMVANCKVLLLGCTFKENVPDIRNSKVFDIVYELSEYNISVDIVDPLVVNVPTSSDNPYQILDSPKENHQYDAMVLAVKHAEFKKYDLLKLQSFSTNNELNLFDIKGFFEKGEAETICKYYWRL